MKLINMTRRPLPKQQVSTVVIDVPENMSISLIDMMFKVMDGEYQPCAVKHYLETVMPSRSFRSIVLPFIKDDALMRDIAEAFGNHRYQVWTNKDDVLTVVH